MMAPAEVARVSALFPDVSFVEVPAHGALPAEVRAEILLVSGPGPNLGPVLERGVRWVHTTATGIERFPTALLGDRLFTCSRGAGAIAISEWVLAMMLAFAKRLPESWTHDATTRWTRADLDTLYERTLCLVGIGGIGTAIAHRALGFGMRVIALRRRPLPSPLPGVEIASHLDTLLERADHLVLAAPLTPSTTHLLDARALRIVKPGLHLVNVSRGGLVDQEALRLALDEGTVERASLDVATPEPLPPDHWLLRHPRVRLSPHISWSAPWGLDRTYAVFRANLDRYLAGEPLAGVVDVAEGY